MPGTFSPPLRVNDPDMHHGTCVTHVPWCMPWLLTSGFLWSRWRGKRPRHSRRMRNPQFYISGKRPMFFLNGCSAACSIMLLGACYTDTWLYTVQSEIMNTAVCCCGLLWVDLTQSLHRHAVSHVILHGPQITLHKWNEVWHKTAWKIIRQNDFHCILTKYIYRAPQLHMRLSKWQWIKREEGGCMLICDILFIPSCQ